MDHPLVSDPDAIIRLIAKVNPKRTGTGAWNQYELLSQYDGSTVGEFSVAAEEARSKNPENYHRYPWAREELQYCLGKRFIALEPGNARAVGSTERLNEALENILSSYLEISQQQAFGQHPDLWSYFETFRTQLEASPILRARPTLKVSWSVGRGNWSRVPWIVLLDERETNSTQRGIYCVLLFCADMSGVYVTYNQGVTDPKRRLGPAEGLAELRTRAAQMRETAQSLLQHGFHLDDDIDLRVDAGLGRDYECSTIAYKLYELGKVPDDQDIFDDIEALVRVYDRYLEGSMADEPNQAGMEAMRDRFLAHFPGFTSFPEAGSDSAYGIEERNYKVELVENFRRSLAPRLQEPVQSDEEEELLAEAVLQFLKQRLESSGKPQNLLTWRDYDFQNHLDGAGKRKFSAMLRDLLYGSGTAGERVETCNQQFEVLMDGTPFKVIPAWTRLVSTFFLMIAFPETEIVVKTTQFNKTAEEVMGWPKLESRLLDAEQYDRMKRLAGVIETALEEWGWEPQDMLDVQSFIWVAQAPKSIVGTEHDEMPEDDQVVPYVPPSFDEIRTHVLETEGLRLSERVLRQYHVALEARGFVILSGISGSGKTWLTEAYANAVGAEYLLVPVAPNWTTNEDLLGFFNPLDSIYHDTAFSRFLRRASDAYTRAVNAGVAAQPYQLALDEMNLARVEYYFAKFLSVMELRARRGTATIELGPNENVLLTPNLQFVGTVNVDETTHGFADKVYDRAQLIELDTPRHLLVEHLGDVPFADALMEAWDCVSDISPFGFRILDDVRTYVEKSQAIGVSWEDALDEQILQKVLPKIKGADPRVGSALQQLVDFSLDRFPLTYAKAVRMLDRFNQHGFTSYF